MTDYRAHVRALIDPEQSDPLADGGRLQDVSIILSDGPGDLCRRPPAAATLLACQARELAFELLVLAEHADRQRTGPSQVPGRGVRRARSRRR